MPTILYRQTLNPRWVDINGGTCTQSFHSQSNPAPVMGSLADVLTSMQAASHCGLVFAQLVPYQNVNEAPATGSYPLVSDRAQIILRSSAGTTGRINIPGPLDALFLPGGERVDFTNPLVEAVVDAAKANLCDAYGNPWVAAVSGRRFKVRIPNPMGS